MAGRRVDLSALDRIRARLGRVEAPDFVPLMVSLMKIIEDDNRRGILKGTDREGVPMKPVTYRPVGRARPTTWMQRNNADRRSRARRFAGFGPSFAGVNNNLSSAEYRRLGGPPLAPRGQYSRVITNLKTAYRHLGADRWEAYGFWDQVVSRRGDPFLIAHFEGRWAGRGAMGFKLPVRDLRGVRPEGRANARRAATNWGRDLARRAATPGPPGPDATASYTFVA